MAVVKNSFGNCLIASLIFLLVAGWWFSGWPQISEKPEIPLRIQQAEAAREDVVEYIIDTASTTWLVPGNWNSASNSIEVIGGGGSGADNVGAGGGGGGAYSKVTNISISGTITLGVGAGGPAVITNNAPGNDGGNTWFNADDFASCVSTSVCVKAEGGKGGGVPTGGAGGSDVAGIGTTVRSGGAGGNGCAGGNSGGGGGGAAGPNGDGVGNVGGGGGGDTKPGAGGGGGGGGGGTDGIVGSSPDGCGASAIDVGGTGGDSWLGGDGGTSGNQGSNGGGGGGGPDTNVGGPGGAGIDWDATYGSGGCGGGGGDQSNGGTGGLYGGGGGGAESNTVGPTGAGAQGIIVITYTPVAVSVTCTTPLTATDFSTIDNTAIYTSSLDATTTVTTDSPTGFLMTVYDDGNGVNPGLYKSAATADLIDSPWATNTDATGTLEAGQEGFGIQATTSSPDINIDIRFWYASNTSNIVGGLEVGAGSAVEIASSTGVVTDQIIFVTHKAAAAVVNRAGSYIDDIVYTCTTI